MTSPDPQPLGVVLSQLFALRGYARVQGDRQLHAIWREVAGEKIAAQTKVAGLKNGVLQVGVSSSALLQELQSFHKFSLLDALERDHADLRIRDIKFRLRGDLGG